MLDDHAYFLLLKASFEYKLHILTALLTKGVDTEIFQNTCLMRGFQCEISLMVTYRKTLGLKKVVQKFLYHASINGWYIFNNLM